MKRRDVLKISATAAAAGPVLAQTQAGWKPEVFSAAQNETVIALTEVLIPATDTPGAKEALVNRFIDKLLAAGPASERERFLEGLVWFEDYVKKQHGSAFSKLNPAEQTKTVESLASAPPEGELSPGHRFFRMAKQMTARIYYQTAIGFRELNKGRRVPATYGCPHPDRHA